MTIAGIESVFLVGCFGGLLAELLKWYQLKESLHFPVYLHNPVYWIITLAMIAAGGVVAVLYGVEARNALLVMQIGLSTPLLVKTLAETSTADSGEGRTPHTGMHGMGGSQRGRPQPSIVHFLAGR